MLLRIAPIMHMTDADRSEAFYRDRLGFTVVRPTEGYLIVERDRAEIHLTRCGDLPGGGAGCYVVTDDVDALYQELLSRGLAIPPPVTQPWGLREVSLQDPDGNLLKFCPPTM